MQKANKQLSKRIISLLMTFLIIIMSAPFTFAAESNTLTPVLVDPINDPPVATKVEAGARLSTSTISGGAVKNPETGEVLANAVWKWQKSRTTVSTSGLYPAYCVSPDIEDPLMMDIYVGIVGDMAETEVEIYPTIDDVIYSPEHTFGDLIINGGKVVEKGTSTEVIGKFEIAEKIESVNLKTGTFDVDIKFVPDDLESYLPIEFTIPVTVNPAIPTFKTEDGSGVPTITVPYGTKLDSSFDYWLKGLIDIESGTNLTFGYKQLNDEELSYSNTTPAVGTHTVQVNVTVQGNENYEKTTPLTFNLVITGFESNCIMKPFGTEGFKIVDESIAYNGTKPAGTFTVNYTIDGVAQEPIEVKYDTLFKPEVPKTGAYSYTVTYNAVENDPFTVSVKGYNEPITLSHKLTATGAITVDKPCGETVEIVAPATDPALAEKPYYGFVKWEVTKGNIGLEEEQLENGTINFTMPDEEVELKATYEFDFIMFIKFIFDTICNWFKSVFASLGTLF